jgi:hypothetical protein
MSTRRKRGSTDQRKHPGNDRLTVIYPDPKMTLPPEGADLDAWFELHPPEIKSEDVTRDEFTRRMAGNPVLDTLHEAGRDVRVISLAEPSAIIQWWNTAPGKTESPR